MVEKQTNLLPLQVNHIEVDVIVKKLLLSASVVVACLGFGAQAASTQEDSTQARAFMDVCLGAVFSAQNPEGTTRYITNLLGESSGLPEAQKRFMPEDNVHAWQYRQGDDMVIVGQPAAESSCHVALTSGEPDDALAFFKRFTETMSAQNFAVHHERTQASVGNDENTVYEVSIVVWELPGVEGAGLMLSLVAPSEHTDESLLGIVGLQLIDLKLFD